MKHLAYKSVTLEALGKLSEKDLQSIIIEPLLRAQGFTHVRDTSGYNDKGKDLIAIKQEFGKSKLYAIQLKKIKIIGKHSMPNSLINLLHQFEQIFSEPVIDPVTNEMRKADRCIFITPYPIKQSALESAISKQKDLERREITIIDGPLLVDEVLSCIPEAIHNINAEYKYRILLADTANRIAESRAFGIGNDLKVEDIYVKINLNYGPNSFLSLDSNTLKKEKADYIIANPEEINSMKSIVFDWDMDTHFWKVEKEETNFEVRKLRRTLNQKIAAKIKRLDDQENLIEDDKTRKDLEKSISELKKSDVYRFDFNLLYEHILIHFEIYKSDYLDINKRTDTQRITQIIIKGIKYNNLFDRLKGNPLISRHCRGFYNELNQVDSKQIEISSQTLLKFNHPVIIRGNPGSGKTTLLRKLSQEMAKENSDQLPVLLFLIRMREINDPQDIIDEAILEISRLGYNLSENELRNKMTKGNCRIFLDGLDELGSAAQKSFEAIKELSNRYSKCPIFVTVRKNIELEPWNSALHVYISEFNDFQLNEFISKWFTAQPSHREGILSWLEKNRDMKTTAKTPIITALLCVLYQSGADMPTTEVELYERRFELLLGRWEQAKGINPLPVEIRKRTFLYLIELAYLMHDRKSRNIKYDEALKVSKGYFSASYHNTAESLLNDCIHRGLLEYDLVNNLSFGHLTYQEFMVGKWLDHHNQVQIFWKYLTNDWWNKSINYYAAIKGDLTGIFHDRNPDKLRGKKKVRVKEILQLAPYTSKKMMSKFNLHNRVE